MPHYQKDFPPQEFKARWAKIYERIGDRAVAVIQGMPQVNGFIFPRQNNEFYYLCGIETPHSYLALDGRSKKAILYMPPRNRRLESAEGRVLSSDDADLVRKLTGADEVLSTAVMKEDQMPVVREAATIYALFSPAEGAEQSRGELRMANGSIKSDHWDGRELRAVKSPREIALVRGRAGPVRPAFVWPQ